MLCKKHFNMFPKNGVFKKNLNLDYWKILRFFMIFVVSSLKQLSKNKCVLISLRLKSISFRFLKSLI